MRAPSIITSGIAMLTSEVVRVGADFYAVGKDTRGKVRKPSSYRPVDLSQLVANS
jgi:hypothetical protein